MFKMNGEVKSKRHCEPIAKQSRIKSIDCVTVTGLPRERISLAMTSQTFIKRVYSTTITILLSIFLQSPIALAAQNSCSIDCTATLNPASPINVGSFDPYSYTNISLPVTLSIACIGTPAESCGSSATVSYSFDFDGGGSGKHTRDMKLHADSVGYSVCDSPSCNTTYTTASSISNSYSFIPSVGRTDQYILYIVVPVQPLSVVGTYSDTINAVFNYSY